MRIFVVLLLLVGVIVASILLDFVRVNTWECAICRKQQITRSYPFKVSRSQEECNEFCVWYNNTIEPNHQHQWLVRASVERNIYGKGTRFGNVGFKMLWQIVPEHELEYFGSGFSKEELILITHKLQQNPAQEALYRGMYSSTNFSKRDLLEQIRRIPE